MEFRLLGPIGVSGADIEPEPPIGRMQRTFFAALALRRGYVVSDTQLNEYLWGATPPSTGMAQIHTYASRLRKWLGPGVSVLRRGQGYLLACLDGGTDVEEFERLRVLGDDAFDRHLPREASACYCRALALWRGPALADATEFLIESEAPALEEARLTVLLNRIEADMQANRAREILPELRRLVAAHPLHEGMRSYLMDALYRCNRQAEALSEYNKLRLTLRDEVGVAPCANISSLFQRILVGAEPASYGR